MQPNYENLGLDTTVLESSEYKGPLTISRGKLKLDKSLLDIDETIETYTRTKKKPYKEVKYKEKVTPLEFEDKTTSPRRSERLKSHKTTWTASKPRRTMLVNSKKVL